MSNHPAAAETPIVPEIPVDLELIKLCDCYPYRRLFPAFHHFTDPETGLVDYASEDARRTFGKVGGELHKLGFRRSEVTLSAAAVLIDLADMRQYVDFVEEPGDLLIHA